MAGAPTPQAWGNDTSDSQGGIVHYRVKYTSGASGAVPTFPLSMSNGITSVAHSGTGVITVVVANNFFQLANVTGGVQQASYSSSGACRLRVTSNAPTTGTIVLTSETAAGAAVDTADGDIVFIDIEVQNYKSQ